MPTENPVRSPRKSRIPPARSLWQYIDAELERIEGRRSVPDETDGTEDHSDAISDRADSGYAGSSSWTPSTSPLAIKVAPAPVISEPQQLLVQRLEQWTLVTEAKKEYKQKVYNDEMYSWLPTYPSSRLDDEPIRAIQLDSTVINVPKSWTAMEKGKAKMLVDEHNNSTKKNQIHFSGRYRDVPSMPASEIWQPARESVVDLRRSMGLTYEISDIGSGINHNLT